MRTLSQAECIDLLRERADAGREHLDAEEVHFGMRLGDLRRRLAHAETDFEHGGRGSAERRREVERSACIGDCDAWKHLIVRTLLRLRGVAAPQHVAANVAMVQLGRRVVVGGFRCSVRRTQQSSGDRHALRASEEAASHRVRGSQRDAAGAMTPLVGDDGEAL